MDGIKTRKYATDLARGVPSHVYTVRLALALTLRYRLRSDRLMSVKGSTNRSLESGKARQTQHDHHATWRPLTVVDLGTKVLLVDTIEARTVDTALTVQSLQSHRCKYRSCTHGYPSKSICTTNNTIVSLMNCCASSSRSASSNTSPDPFCKALDSFDLRATVVSFGS